MLKLVEMTQPLRIFGGTPSSMAGAMFGIAFSRKPLTYRALLCLVCALILQSGCSPVQDTPEVAKIKENYFAFRTAIIAKDLNEARKYASSNFTSFSPEQFREAFKLLLRPNAELTTNSYIRFERGRVWLWPQSQPKSGIDGIGFQNENGEWKIKGDFMGVD
jgi:hypothetical protein